MRPQTGSSRAMSRRTAGPVDEILQQAAALHRNGMLREAEGLYADILRRTPNHFAALHLLGLVHLQSGKPERALERLRKAVRSEPGALVARRSLGAALIALGRFDEALDVYDHVISIDPEHVESLLARAGTCVELGRLEAALATYDSLIARWPEHVEAHHHRANLLAQLGHLDEAVSGYDKVLSIKPKHAPAHHERGNALRLLGHFDAALASYDMALRYAAAYPEALNSRGNLLRVQGRYDDALLDFKAALSCRANYAEAHNNLGNVLGDLGRVDEAIGCFDRAISLRPDYAEAHWNKGITLLQEGRFAEGWRQHEWRLKKPGAMPHRCRQPVWDGRKSLAGRDIFLHWEQGFGDTLQFCRYAPLIGKRGARVTLSVQEPLLQLLRQLEPMVTVIGENEVPEKFDLHCPLLSLPHLLATELETIPAGAAYLSADADLARTWAARLPTRHRPRVGIEWRGNPRHANDRNRSIAPAFLSPLLALDLDWISLQPENSILEMPEGAKGHVHNFGAALRDFAETAALISQLDLVITVDTAVAHLAAALGKPVWVLLSFSHDWRWLRHRSDSPWYPTARLFRQPRPGDWANVIAEVGSELRELETHSHPD